MSRIQTVEQKDMDRFSTLGQEKYCDQLVFFLNAFWVECGADAEKIYGYYQGFLALDTRKDDGCDLDEFYSHKFLENYGETLTALELRNAMRKIDINHDNRMCLLEYLLFRYEQAVQELLNRPQQSEGAVMTPELIKALAALQTVRAEIRKIELKKAELEERGSKGGVKGNAAKQELFALLNTDPTELNAAVLTAEAAVRKAGGSGKVISPGLVWYMERELEEAKKYKPKGGLQKADKFKDL